MRRNEARSPGESHKSRRIKLKSRKNSLFRNIRSEEREIVSLIQEACSSALNTVKMTSKASQPKTVVHGSGLQRHISAAGLKPEASTKAAKMLGVEPGAMDAIVSDSHHKGNKPRQLGHGNPRDDPAILRAISKESLTTHDEHETSSPASTSKTRSKSKTQKKKTKRLHFEETDDGSINALPEAPTLGHDANPYLLPPRNNRAVQEETLLPVVVSRSFGGSYKMSSIALPWYPKDDSQPRQSESGNVIMSFRASGEFQHRTADQLLADLRFDDYTLMTRLREQYYGYLIGGGLLSRLTLRYLSARRLSYLQVVSVADKQVVSGLDYSEPLRELMKAFQDPENCRGQHKWVLWARKMADVSSQSDYPMFETPFDFDEEKHSLSLGPSYALEFVEGWRIRRIALVTLFCILAPFVLALAWILIEPKPSGPLAGLDIDPSTKKAARVQSGCILFMAVTLFEASVVGSWLCLSRMVM